MDLPGSLFDFSWRLGDYVGAPAGLGGSQVKIEKQGLLCACTCLTVLVSVSRRVPVPLLAGQPRDGDT